MKQTSTMILKGSLMAFSLMLVSGCNLFKKNDTAPAETKATTPSNTNDVVLCTINGEPAIKESEFINNLNQMIQGNPYFKGATIESLPKELLRKFMDQLATQALIEQHSIKQNIEKDPEFIKAYNETEKLIKRALMVQTFEKRIYDSIKVSDNDIAKHYKENKDRFVKVAGGVLAMGAKFDKEEDADAFYAKVKGHADNFEKLAKDTKSAKVRDFGRVSKEARNGMQFDVIPAPVKETVLGMTKLPGIDKVKAGKEYWVIKAWDKKDTVLFDLDEVKTHVEGMLKTNQFRDALDKRVKEIKEGFKLNINEEYFKDKAQQSQQDDKEADEEPKEAASAA